MMKNIIGQKIHLYKKIGIFIGIFILLFSCFFPKTTAEAASLKIRYGGKNYNYTSAQAKATLDGKSINLDKTPGVLLNDTCMLSAKDVFKNALKAKFTYNSKTKKIVISQNNIKIVMTLDSKTAYVNDKKKTMDVAPMMIKFAAVNKSKLYVPARFVAESLGYTYTWNSSTKTSDMIKPFVIKYDGEWTVYKGVQGKTTFDGKAVSSTAMPNIIMDSTALLRASTVFKTALGAEYTYDKSAKTVTISQNGITIVMTIDSKEALVNDVPYTMGTAARVVYNKDTGKSYVMVPGEFTATKLGYKYSWNAGAKTSEIRTGTKIYFSQSFNEDLGETAGISVIEASNLEKKDIISIKGSSVTDVIITEPDSTTLQLTFNNVSAATEPLSKSVTGLFLQSITVEDLNGSTVITIKKDPQCNYYSSSTRSEYKLVLSENEESDIENSVYQMKVTMPEELEYSLVTTEDLYYNNQFIINIPGDYTSFFYENPISYDSMVVDNASVAMDNNGNTVITVDTNQLQGYKLVDCGTYIGIKIEAPSSIYSKIVVLDPGHGGTAVGTSKNKIYEKDLNFTILYDLAKEYFNSPDSDIKAYWSRYDDSDISLYDRAAFADKVGADAFISLHMNSATPSASGTEVLYTSNKTNHYSALTSKQMADFFQEYLVSELGLSGRKTVNRPNLVVLRDNTVPAILIELGFLSNSKDFSYITDPEFQDLTAQTIYEATVAMFDAFPTGRE